jgi:hypothetical protein
MNGHFRTPFLENALQVIFAPYITFLKRPPSDRPSMAAFKVVECNWCEPGTGQSLARVASDKSCAAGY